MRLLYIKGFEVDYITIEMAFPVGVLWVSPFLVPHLDPLFP
jgi:hypothetical protein